MIGDMRPRRTRPKLLSACASALVDPSVFLIVLPPAMADSNLPGLHSQPTITLMVGNRFCQHDSVIITPALYPPQEEDDIHLHILRSRLTRTRILRLTKKLRILRNGPLFITHPLLARPYILWAGTRASHIRAHARRLMKGSIYS